MEFFCSRVTRSIYHGSFRHWVAFWPIKLDTNLCWANSSVCGIVSLVCECLCVCVCLCYYRAENTVQWQYTAIKSGFDYAEQWSLVYVICLENRQFCILSTNSNWCKSPFSSCNWWDGEVNTTYKTHAFNCHNANIWMWRNGICTSASYWTCFTHLHKDGWRIATFFHFTKIKLKYPGYEHCHLMLVTFGARVQASRQRSGEEYTLPCNHGQSLAVNDGLSPCIYSIK